MNTITNRSLEIKRVPVSRMLKAEVAEYARKVISITDKEELLESIIFPLIEKQHGTDHQIVMLSIRYGIDPMREIIANYKSEIMLTVRELELRTHSIAKRKNDAGLRLIKNSIDTYLKKLAKSKNDKEISNNINGFANEIDANRKLSEAIDAHKLTDIVDRIFIAKSDFNNSWEKRIKLLSERQKMKTKEIVEIVYTPIVNLFKAIEVAHLLNPEEDHTALALELNQLSDMYNRSIAIRLANNKRKLDREKERLEGMDNNEGEEGEGAEGEGAEGENAENEDAQPMATGMHAGNDWTNEWDNDWDDEWSYNEEDLANPFESNESPAEELHSNSEEVDDEEAAVAVE